MKRTGLISLEKHWKASKSFTKIFVELRSIYNKMPNKYEMHRFDRKFLKPLEYIRGVLWVALEDEYYELFKFQKYKKYEQCYFARHEYEILSKRKNQSSKKRKKFIHKKWEDN